MGQRSKNFPLNGPKFNETNGSDGAVQELFRIDKKFLTILLRHQTNRQEAIEWMKK
jgi:hypothetical protein